MEASVLQINLSIQCNLKVLADFYEEIDEMIFKFIWKGKRTKITKTILIASYLISVLIIKLQ